MDDEKLNGHIINLAQDEGASDDPGRIIYDTGTGNKTMMFVYLFGAVVALILLGLAATWFISDNPFNRYFSGGTPAGQKSNGSALFAGTEEKTMEEAGFTDYIEEAEDIIIMDDTDAGGALSDSEGAALPENLDLAEFSEIPDLGQEAAAPEDPLSPPGADALTDPENQEKYE